MKDKPQKTLLFLGDSGVGKTTMLKMIQDKHEKVLSTIGVDCAFYEGRDSKLKCWDLSGAKSFNFLVPHYLLDADIVVLTCSLSDETSVISLAKWFSLIQDDLKDKKLVLFINSTAMADRLSVENVIDFVRDLPFSVIYHVDDPLDCFCAFDELSAGLVSDEIKAEQKIVLPNHDLLSRGVKSALLLNICQRLEALLVNSSPRFYCKAPAYRAEIERLLSIIYRGVLTDIEQIKQSLKAIDAKPVKSLLAYIEDNHESFEMVSLSSEASGMGL